MTFGHILDDRPEISIVPLEPALNSFLAMKISYINLMANLCEKTDADIEQVAKKLGFEYYSVGRK